MRPGVLDGIPIDSGGGGAAFDPLTLPGMQYFVHSDDVTPGGTGNQFALSIPNRMPSGEIFSRGGGDTLKFTLDTTTFPGHTALKRLGIGTVQNLANSATVLAANFNGLQSVTFGCFCQLVTATAPGAVPLSQVQSTGNQYGLTAPSNVATSGMRLAIAGQGTAGGAVVGQSTGDVAYTRDTITHLLAASYDLSTQRVTHTVDGVVAGITAPLVLREPINLTTVCLGALTAPTAAADEVIFVSWFGATSIYDSATLAKLTVWLQASVA